MPTPAEARALYREFMRIGHRFPDYNIREYIKRRAQEGFRSARSVADAAQLEALWKAAQGQLQVARRQNVVYSLYVGDRKSIMDLPVKAAKPT